ncbi:MAG: hypothetical protein QW261_15945, partial [Candidatus Jordarchaeaceae archaeon]
RCRSTHVKKGHGNYGQELKCYRCKTCGRTLNDRTGTLQYSRLKLREWFTLISLLLALHNSALNPGCFPGRGLMFIKANI